VSGGGWPSHNKDELARIGACYTEVDQPTGCPMCILRAENERLRDAAKAREEAERERDIHLKDAAAVREERDGARRWSQHYLAQINELEQRALAAESRAAEREERGKEKGNG